MYERQRQVITDAISGYIGEIANSAYARADQLGPAIERLQEAVIESEFSTLGLQLARLGTFTHDLGTFHEAVRGNAHAWRKWHDHFPVFGLAVLALILASIEGFVFFAEVIPSI